MCTQSLLCNDIIWRLLAQNKSNTFDFKFFCVYSVDKSIINYSYSFHSKFFSGNNVAVAHVVLCIVVEEAVQVTRPQEHCWRLGVFLSPISAGRCQHLVVYQRSHGICSYSQCHVGGGWSYYAHHLPLHDLFHLARGKTVHACAPSSRSKSVHMHLTLVVS